MCTGGTLGACCRGAVFHTKPSSQGGHEHSGHLPAEDRASGHGGGHPQRHLLQPQWFSSGRVQPRCHAGGLGVGQASVGHGVGSSPLPPASPSQPCLMPSALLQVAGLRGLILRSQLIVLLKHKVGGAAWRPFRLCLSPGAPVPLLPPAPCCLPCPGGAGRGSLSVTKGDSGGCCAMLGLPQHHPAPC